MRRPFLFLSGIAAILLAVFTFYPDRNVPVSRSSDLKTGPKVFRTKIPGEIKLARNIFRGKIPVMDQPAKPAKKTESMPPAEIIVMPSQPGASLPEKLEPRLETGHVEPAAPPAKTETTPAAADTLTPPSIFTPPEKIEPLPEIAHVEPDESQAMIETTSSVENAVPSEPIEPPPEKNLAQEGFEEPNLQPEPQTKLETSPSKLEESAYTQPAVTTGQQVELPEKTDIRQNEILPQPAKKEITRETEERIIQHEDWLLSQKSSNYTIQLMGTHRESVLLNFVERNQLLKQNEVAYYQTSFKDKPWFQLLYGVYATKKDAQSAADSLPPKIRQSSPWIRRLSAVQKSIRKRAAR